MDFDLLTYMLKQKYFGDMSMVVNDVTLTKYDEDIVCADLVIDEEELLERLRNLQNNEMIDFLYDTHDEKFFWITFTL